MCRNNKKSNFFKFFFPRYDKFVQLCLESSNNKLIFLYSFLAFTLTFTSDKIISLVKALQELGINQQTVSQRGSVKCEDSQVSWMEVDGGDMMLAISLSVSQITDTR